MEVECYKIYHFVFIYFFFLVPPKKPIIHDANGRKMTSTLGPYKVGEKLIATCISSAGKSRGGSSHQPARFGSARADFPRIGLARFLIQSRISRLKNGSVRPDTEFYRSSSAKRVKKSQKIEQNFIFLQIFVTYSWGIKGFNTP